MQKIFGTLEYFGGQSDGVSLADLRKISQLPLTKLKVVLALLKKATFIEMRAKGRYGLTEDALKNRELVLNLANYDTKKSYDQSKLAMMLQYSEIARLPPEVHLELFRRGLRTRFVRCVRQLFARGQSHADGNARHERLSHRRCCLIIRNSGKARSSVRRKTS